MNKIIIRLKTIKYKENSFIIYYFKLFFQIISLSLAFLLLFYF